MAKEEGLILIKIGDHYITDLVEKIASPKGQEELVGILKNLQDGKAMPHYMYFSRTNQEQQEAYVLWLDWLVSMVDATEEKEIII